MNLWKYNCSDVLPHVLRDLKFILYHTFVLYVIERNVLQRCRELDTFHSEVKWE